MCSISKNADHLRSLLVSAVISCLFIGNIFISFMICHELKGLKWYHTLSVSLVVLLLPYMIVSSLLMHSIYGPNFLCMAQLDVNPIHILFGSEQRNCCNTSNSCMKYLNLLIKTLAFCVTIFFLPILNIFICSDHQYFNSILIQLSLILMNTINHLAILCTVPPQSILAMLSIISCRITIFYILLSIFIFTYGHLSTKIINYRKYRYIASLTICVELLLAFIMFYITFVVQYDTLHSIQYTFTMIGFINYICPNLPFSKSRLIIKFAFNASKKWLFHFVLNGDVSEMYNRFYFCIHHITFHDNADTLCDLDESVALLMNIDDNKDTKHHQLYDIECAVMQYDFMRMDTEDKMVHIMSLFDTGKSGFMRYNICGIIYVASSVMACLFPVLWILIVFESSLVVGWMDVLIYGSILMYIGFMGRVFYYFFKLKLSTNLITLIKNVTRLDTVHLGDTKEIMKMYKQHELVLIVMDTFYDKDIAFCVLSFVLENSTYL